MISYKKRIIILLGHAVIVPTKSTGGVEKVFQEIFSKWDDDNFEYILICKGNVKKTKIERVSTNKEIIYLKGFRWTASKLVNITLSLFWCLKAKTYLANADLVIYNSLFGPLVHRVFKLKGLVSYCDQRGTGKVNYFIPHFTLDRLYAISKVVQNSWDKKYVAKVKIIPNCVDTNLFKFVDRYKNESDSYNIIFIGRIIEEKGLIILLKALHIFINEYDPKNVTLKIIGPFQAEKGGNESYYLKCKQYIALNKMNNIAEFLGEKNTDEIIGYLSNSDIFIMASIWDEAFGIVNIEALATGLPIVGFNKGALSEIINDKQEGFIVKEITAEALAKSIAYHYYLDKNQKIIMGKNCRQKAELYDSRNIANLYLADIRGLLK